METQMKYHHNGMANHAQTPQYTGWRPFCLRRRALTGFIFLLLALFAAVQVIHSYVSDNQGLTTANPSLHYLWTYGPTAVFILLSLLWRQIDFTVRLLTPWVEMARGPTPADKSVLLDYISPILPVTFYQACKNRHFRVSSTSLGSTLFKLLIVASSGFLALETVYIENIPVQLKASTTFNANKFNASVEDAHPAWTVFALGRNLLSNTPDMVDGYLAQSFNATTPTLPSGAQLSAEVDAFSAGLDCETARVTLLSSNTLIGGDSCQNVRLATDSCVKDLKCPGGFSFGGGEVSLVNCDGNSDLPKTHLLIWSAYRKLEGQYDPYVEFSGTFCKPVYNINRVISSVDYVPSTQPGSASAVLSQTSQARGIEGVTAMDIARSVLNSAGSTTDRSLVMSLPFPDNPKYEQKAENDFYRVDDFLSLMALYNNVTLLSISEDSNVLQSTANSTFNAIAREIAKLHLTSPAEHEFQGSYSHEAQRLFSQELSVRLIQAGLIIIAILIVFLSITTPSNLVVSCSPSSIGALAAILSRSPSLTQTLSGTGHVSWSSLQNLLAGSHYKTVFQMDGTTPVFSIEQVSRSPDSNPEQTASDTKADESSLWWQPLPFLVWFIALVLCAPVVIIVVIEVTHQLSASHDGIGTVVDNDFLGYLWTYLPTILLVSIATMFDALNFQAQASQPHRALHTGKPAEQGLLSNLLKRSSLLDLWDAFKYWEIPLLFSAISVIIAPFLAIIASGLFVPETVGVANELTVELTDKLVSNGALGEDGEDDRSITTNLLQLGNVSYPDWTYDELVLSSVKMPPQKSTNIDAQDFQNSTILNLQLPALRPNPNCSVVPPDMYNVKLEEDEFTYDPILELNYPELYGCPVGIDAGYPYSKDTGVGFFTTNPYGMASVSNRPCAQAVAYFGHVSRTPPAPSGGSLILCWPFLETVDVNTTLEVKNPGPNASLTIDTTRPPVANESTAKFLTKDITENYRVDEILQPTTGGDFALDPFFQHLVNGRDGVPLAELDDPGTLVEAVDHLLAVLYAQYMHHTRRVPFSGPGKTTPMNENDADDNNGGNGPDSAKSPFLTGTLTNPNRMRLKQSEVSTRLLQAAMGTMFLCAVGIVITLDRKRILPKNPQSIASTASLLAGSQLLDTIPEGAEWWDRKTMKERHLFEEQEYRLGWWSPKKVADGSSGESDSERQRSEEGDSEGSLLAGARFGIDVVPTDSDGEIGLSPIYPQRHRRFFRRFTSKASS